MSRRSIRFRSSGPSLTSGTMRSRYRRHAEAKGLDRKEQKARQVTLHPPRLPSPPPASPLSPSLRSGQALRERENYRRVPRASRRTVLKCFSAHVLVAYSNDSIARSCQKPGTCAVIGLLSLSVVHASLEFDDDAFPGTVKVDDEPV